jgi:hypothetical protein
MSPIAQLFFAVSYSKPALVIIRYLIICPKINVIFNRQSDELSKARQLGSFILENIAIQELKFSPKLIFLKKIFSGRWIHLEIKVIYILKTRKTRRVQS